MSSTSIRASRRRSLSRSASRQPRRAWPTRSVFERVSPFRHELDAALNETPLTESIRTFHQEADIAIDRTEVGSTLSTHSLYPYRPCPTSDLPNVQSPSGKEKYMVFDSRSPTSSISHHPRCMSERRSTQNVLNDRPASRRRERHRLPMIISYFVLASSFIVHEHSSFKQGCSRWSSCI